MAQEYGVPLQAEAGACKAEMELYCTDENAGDLFNPLEKPTRSGSIASCTSGGAAGQGMTVHEASRAKKAVDCNVKSIQNRIKFFQREEEKIWRDLEEVRRQASTIEEGRTRTLEKKLADRTIQQEKEIVLQQNRSRAAATRSGGEEQRKRNQLLQNREKRLAAEDQRQVSKDIVRQKREQEAQARLQNTRRASAILSSKLESKRKVDEEKAHRLDGIRIQHEAERQAAEAEFLDAEAQLPQLEAEELICLQRLQNSRIVTQSVLEELENSLGKQSAVTSLLRSKQRGQDPLATASVGSMSGSGLISTEEGPATPEPFHSGSSGRGLH